MFLKLLYLLPALISLLAFTSTPLSANSVLSFTLINADDNTEISPIISGGTISLATLPSSNINIKALTSPPSVDQVTFSLTGATTISNSESVAPYALWGDSGGDYNPGKLNPGNHNLSATATTGGTAGPPYSVDFTVLDDASGMPAADAGDDKTIFLPTNSVTLNGSGIDSDGTISHYSWTQLSGPAMAEFNTQESSTVLLSSLLQGTYKVRLTVTDNAGNTGADDVFIYVNSYDYNGAAISGELKKWHKVTLTFDGPSTSESADVNPFRNYRLNVTFTTGPKSYTVPGYFAADGDSANSSATSGNKWRVHFAPPATGVWNYSLSFRTGTDIVGDASPTAGTAVNPLDGTAGSFTIAPTDKGGRDNRAKGLLEYVGGHYLQFAETREYFLKQGADAPENFLAYDDFDNTPNNGDRRKSWSAHVKDWRNGDPTWKGNKGKGIIGAINYLASEGMNAFSFIPMNIGGDDKNVFPYISDNTNDRTRIDCSKMDQWEKVFEHADSQGMFLHFKTQETENELLLDGGNMGLERTIYYRELIARFGHHLALNWNLGEEINNASTAQKQAWAQYFYDNDPYHHHIVIHNMGNPHYDLLGAASKLTGFSLQTSSSDFSGVHSRVEDYLSRSAEAGKPWAVACDEPGDATHALRPDNDAGNSHEDGRKNGLWGTFMAGGYGNEWYFGYAHDHSDLTCQDFRSRDTWWDYCRFALDFFTNNSIPFWKMVNDNTISSSNDDYAFYLETQVYVVYLKNGGTTNLDLTTSAGTFEIKWYDPRNGGELLAGSQLYVSGGDWAPLGSPPNSEDQDWVILVRKTYNYTIKDSIVALQVLSGQQPAPADLAYIITESQDQKVGLPQVIQILQHLGQQL